MGYKDKRLVSQSITRDRNEARVVITLEVSLDIDTMKSLPGYKRDAISFLRELVAEHSTPHGILAAIEEKDGVYVSDTNIQVAG